MKNSTFSQKLNKFSAKTQQNYQKTQGTGGFGPLPTLGNRPKKEPELHAKIAEMVEPHSDSPM